MYSNIGDFLQKTLAPVTQPWLNIFPLCFVFRYSFISYIASYQYLPAMIKYDTCGLGTDEGEKSGVSDPVSVGYTIYDSSYRYIAIAIAIRKYISSSSYIASY